MYFFNLQLSQWLWLFVKTQVSIQQRYVASYISRFSKRPLRWMGMLMAFSQ